MRSTKIRTNNWLELHGKHEFEVAFYEQGSNKLRLDLSRISFASSIPGLLSDMQCRPYKEGISKHSLE